MQTFFHGWRRKVGCFTLVMACLVTGLWVRSLVVWDWLLISPKTGLLFELKSEGGRLCFERRSLREYETALSMDWDSDRRKPHFGLFAYVDHPYDDERFGWRWKGAGFVAGRYNLSMRGINFVVAPHWSVAIPLLVISAYLILGKPRVVVQTDLLTLIEDSR